MTKKNLRYLSVLILDKVFNDKSYSNLILKEYLQKYDLKDVDKRLITEIVYGTVKYKLSIDNIINIFVKKFDERDISTVILRSAIYQLRYLDKVPEYAVLNESVEASKLLCNNRSKFINGVLRNYLRNKDITKNKKNTLQYEYSFATWMINLFKTQYPGEYINLMSSLNERGDTCCRINSLKYSKEDFLHKFSEFKIENLEQFQNALKIRDVSDITNSHLYKEGLLSIQDLSSQLVCEILNPRTGDTIIDLCAAPGGKSTYIAELIKDDGKIISCDVHEHKIKLIKNNIFRLGIKSIECFVNDATIVNDNFLDLADKVLLDAPCSGFGVIKKKPEIKWFKNQSDLEEIISVQKKIINIASRYVKKNGILMYTTCTLNKNENENIINNFLSNNKNFVIEEIDVTLFRDLKIENINNMITLFPSKINDGFFMCKLRKI